jgi:hypothetical protein
MSSGSTFEVQAFRDRLRSIKDEGAKLEECKIIRDNLLEQHTDMLYLFTSIESVMLTECTRYKELKSRRTNSKSKDADWERWARFAGIVHEGEKVKGECTAPINKAITYWGKDLVKHYRFLHVGTKFCKMLGTTVSRIHSWEEASAKINQITLVRNCCRASVNPISQGHLEILTNWKGCTDFVKKGRGGYTLKYQPISESDLPAEYALDKYGLVILRQFADRPQSPMEVEVACITPHHPASENGSSTAEDRLLALLSRTSYNNQTPTESTTSTPISFPSLPTTRSPTPVQSPEMTEAPIPSKSTASRKMRSLCPADTAGMTLRRSGRPCYASSQPCKASPLRPRRARPTTRRSHGRLRFWTWTRMSALARTKYLATFFHHLKVVSTQESQKILP